MYTVFILGLRKRNRNTFASSSLLSGKAFEDRSIRRSRGRGALKVADIATRYSFIGENRHESIS